MLVEHMDVDWMSEWMLNACLCLVIILVHTIIMNTMYDHYHQYDSNNRWYHDQGHYYDDGRDHCCCHQSESIVCLTVCVCVYMCVARE